MSTQTHQRTRTGFTMLELVVVVGIIALATAFLIRTVSLVHDRAGDVACQGNLRHLLGALQMYNVDNNGSMPFGYFYVGSGPPTWGPVNGSDAFISWATELNKYFNVPKGFAPAFRCPDAQQQAGPHLVSYVINFIVGITPYDEIRMSPQAPPAQTKPPSLHLMLREGTAVIWDTPIKPSFANTQGYLTGADIDGQRFWNGAHTPQFRYFSPHDPFGQFPPGGFGHNRPVTLNVGGVVYQNIDPPATASYPYQGNLRFRHTDQTQCNAAFSDGSVRQFTATIGTNNTVSSHDALRRYFMIHWPPRTRPNPSVPH